MKKLIRKRELITRKMDELFQGGYFEQSVGYTVMVLMLPFFIIYFGFVFLLAYILTFAQFLKDIYKIIISGRKRKN